MPEDLCAAETIAQALDLVMRDFEPLVATFFGVSETGEIHWSVAQGSHLPPAELAATVRRWKTQLRTLDPLPPWQLAATGRPVLAVRDLHGVRMRSQTISALSEVVRRIGVVNDVRVPIRDDAGRVVAGVTLWRSLRDGGWPRERLRPLEALQPLIEAAYLAASRAAARVEVELPASLTGRQREVARLLATGASNREIARALQISPDTAKSHTRAVLGKLGARSRRELVLRLARCPTDHGDDDRRGPGDRGAGHRSAAPAHRPTLRVEGADTARRVLALALGWAAERVNGRAGGCAVLSPRLEQVAEARGVAPPHARGVDLRLACRIQRQLLPPTRPARILASILTARGSPVAELGDEIEETCVSELLGSARLARPLIMTLEREGRLAGVVWIACDGDAVVGQRESVRLMRAVHPLLERACAPALADAQASCSGVSDLDRRGLTVREQAVAQLAIGGDSNVAIATRLGVAPSTVKNHMTRVLAKCGVRQRTQLIALALGQGEPPERPWTSLEDLVSDATASRWAFRE